MDNRLINIRFADGNVKRLPRAKADELVDSGKAQFISKTLYKAALAGVKVKKGASDAKIKKAIRAALQPNTVKPEKERQPQKRRRKKQKETKEATSQ